MDYRELNKYVDSHTANADVCAQKLREWRQKGSNVTVLDLRRVYLQVHVDKPLWPFQTVKIKGQRYCLTRLGFGLNMAPIIMRSIINMAMAQDETIQGATSSYTDDIFVNESACTAACMRDHLLQFGLICKDPERLRDGTRVLGLHVMKKHGKLQWCRVVSFQCCLTYSLVGASFLWVGNWRNICVAGSASQLHSRGGVQTLWQQAGTTKHHTDPRFKCYRI